MSRAIRRLGAATALLSMLGCSGGSRPERGSDGNRLPTRLPSPDTGSRADGGAALRVTLYGIGPIRAGMSVAEASAALGSRLELPAGVDVTECEYLRWPGGPTGVSIMVEQLRIARVDERSGTVATEEGAKVGDPADRIRDLYAGRVTASPHKYTAGEYLTVVPALPADREFRLVFETEAGRVTRYRSGKLPSVEYVEGCS
jgi:hypothetical protein